MKIMRMPDVDRFLKVVKCSTGSVFLHLPDDTYVDLKEDNTARQLLHLITPGEDGLRFSFTESSDVPAFIHYIAESAYPENTTKTL